LETAFAGKLVRPGEQIIGDHLVSAVLLGGYPDLLRRNDSGRRRTRARDSVRAIVQRDVRDIAEVEKLDRLPRLLQILAHHSGQLINFTWIGGQTDRKRTGELSPVFLQHE
jgi:predicted AAA+ superfamily ATPase